MTSSIKEEGAAPFVSVRKRSQDHSAASRNCAAGGLGGKTRRPRIFFARSCSAFGEGEGGIRAERQRGDVSKVLAHEADVGELAVVEAGERGERATMVCDPEGPGRQVEGETAEAYERSSFDRPPRE